MKTIQSTEVRAKMLAHAENFLVKNFSLPLDIPININNRLRTSGGVFKYTSDGKGNFTPLKIEIAKFMIESGTPTEIIETLEHELVHYALCALRKPHRDSDSVFKITCQRLNIPLSHKVIKNLYQYECVDCHKIHEIARVIPENRYFVCDRCHAKVVKNNPCTIVSKQLRILK